MVTSLSAASQIIIRVGAIEYAVDVGSMLVIPYAY